MAHTIDTQRFNKFRLQLELLATHTSYNAEEFVFKYYYSNVSVPTYNYGDIRLHSVQYKLGEYFIIEYYLGNVRLYDSYSINKDGELICNAVVNEIVHYISDCIDCLTIVFAILTFKFGKPNLLETAGLFRASARAFSLVFGGQSPLSFCAYALAKVMFTGLQ